MEIISCIFPSVSSEFLIPMRKDGLILARSWNSLAFCFGNRQLYCYALRRKSILKAAKLSWKLFEEELTVSLLLCCSFIRTSELNLTTTCSCNC